MSLIPVWYPIVWEELVQWRRKFWLYLATYMLSPVIFLVSFGFGAGRRFGMVMPGETSYLEFLVPGVVALAVFNNGVTSVTMRMFYNRIHFQTFETYRLAPMGPLALWSGYAVSGTMRGFLAGLIVLGIVKLVVPGVHPNLSFLGSMLLASFCFGTLGVLIGLYLRSFDDQSLISEFVLVPITFLSGTLIPVERLPPLLRECMWVSPLTPVATLLRSDLAKSCPSWELMAFIGGWSFAFFLAGWLRLRQQDT